MSRSLEARLSRIEGASGGARETHEDRLERLAKEPLSEEEMRAQDEQAIGMAISEHGSLKTAAAAYREKAARAKDPLDSLYAGYLEYICEQREVANALA